MTDDLGRADRDAGDPTINWAVGFAPDLTDVFFHDDVVIAATAERVFACLTDATAWEAWYPGISRCEAPAVLSRGQMFCLEFLQRSFDVAVAELEVERRFGWVGVSADLSVYHAWVLCPQGDGVRTVIEVSARGPAAARISRSRTELLTKIYRAVLMGLKARVEQSVQP